MLTRILIVDDEKLIRESLSEALENEDYRIDTAADGEAAMTKIQGETPGYDIVISDLKMGRISGHDLLIWIRDNHPQIDVVIITAFGTVETAVEAMKVGAVDYITKPLDLLRLRTIIRRIIEKRELVAENRTLRQRFGYDSREIVVGNSSAIRAVYDTVAQVADTDATVLIEGESGTGKEVVAQAIHNRSSRKNKPFILVNCAALPTTLLENELFGHEREAFTGASTLKKGRFEQANSGTIFLDEITEMSLESQSGFLRVLEDGGFHRVGGSQLIRVDVRIIAASNKKVHESCESGKFRFDLYYRLNVVPIFLPPLRQRVEDIPVLIQAFLGEFCEKYHKSGLELSMEALHALRNYDWPGNIRELRNTMERMVILAKSSTISLKNLPEKISGISPDTPVMSIQPGMSLKDMEKALITATLRNVDGHRKTAAQMLGISVRSLQYKIKEYALNP